MASGHPDWREYEGGIPKGTSISVEDFSEGIGDGATDTIDITAVKEYDEIYYNFLVISCLDDTAIHRVKLTRISDGAVLFDTYFNLGGIFNLSSVKLLSGEQARISITNNAAGNVTFKGVISWASRFSFYSAEPPGGGGDTCFLAGTKILMSDGSDKNIEEVKINDVVVSYDLKLKQQVAQKVIGINHIQLKDNGDFYVVINNRIRADPGQLIYTNRRWREAQDLKVGDMLLCIGGASEEITSIKKVYDKVPSYELSIENTFLHFADGVLVHNVCPF